MKKSIKLIKDGNKIISMKNTHTGTNRDIILITKNMNIEGQLALDGDKIYLGYNETILCYDKDTAEHVFTKIAEILAQ